MRPRRSWRSWRAGMSLHHRRLNQRRWAIARRAALGRDGYRCTRCGLAGKLEVHHKKPLHKGGLPFALDNLAVLCVACHVSLSVFPPRLEWRNYLKTEFQEINQ